MGSIAPDELDEARELVAVTIAADQPDGAYLVGEYIGLRDARPREVPGRDGAIRTFQNCDVGFRVHGGGVEVVQFPSREAAEAFVQGWAIGERRACPVVNRFGVKDGRAWQFYTAPYRGGERAAFADEFGA